uniref:Protein-tyrosine-phosphatase n=1 Tax=Steinernema glaseri TaxID=37863 RepID=A0A1I8AK35_9BILA
MPSGIGGSFCSLLRGLNLRSPAWMLAFDICRKASFGTDKQSGVFEMILFLVSSRYCKQLCASSCRGGRVMAAHYGVAAVNLLGLFVFLPCNVLMAWAIVEQSDLWEQWAFRILFHINVADVIFLIPSGMAAAFSISGVIFSDYLPTIAFLDLETMPVIQGILCLTLALNRLFVFAQWKSLDTKEVYRIFFITAWIGGVFWLLLYLCSLKSTFFYSFSKHTFDIETIIDGQPQTFTKSGLDSVKIAMCMLWFSLIIFCAALSLIILCCKSYEIKNEEVGIFFQTLIPVAFLIVAVLADHYDYVFIEELGIIVGPMTGVLLFRIIPPSIHVIILMITNKKIRQAVFNTVETVDMSQQPDKDKKRNAEAPNQNRQKILKNGKDSKLVKKSETHPNEELSQVVTSEANSDYDNESSVADLKTIDLQPNEKTKIVMRRFVQATVHKGVQKVLQEYQELKICENSQKLKSDAFAKNADKNRYKDQICLDKTRVVLQWPPSSKNDYIHANWVRGLPDTQKDIICTQGPLTSTREDFWRMIWQEKCAVIIMLCAVTECGKNKCDQYWPLKAGDKLSILGLTITNLGVEQSGNELAYTRLNISGTGRDGGKRDHLVNHVLWTGWPDKGVPATSTGALKLIIRTQHLQPAVVHCSAGVGRTGTIVALESCIRVLDAGNELSIYNVLRTLRSKRHNACQTDLQYLYLHRAVIAFILSKNVVTPEEIAPFICEYDALVEQRGKDKTPDGTPAKSPVPPPEKK